MPSSAMRLRTLGAFARHATNVSLETLVLDGATVEIELN